MEDNKPEKICSSCQAVFQMREKITHPNFTLGANFEKLEKHKNEPSPRVIPHHRSFIDFEASANGGCRLCHLFYMHIPSDIRPLLRDENPEGPGSIIVRFAINQRFGQYDIEVWYPFSASGRLSQSTNGYRAKLHVSPFSETNGNVCQSLSDHTNSSDCWKMVEKWLENCLTNHPHCSGRPREERSLPSRLIAIGSSSSFSDLRLISTATLSPNVRYAALSHCWGSTPTLTLKTDTLEALKKGMKFESLPLTFQHAILATRQLSSKFNIQYLWIDSLCIIQDSTPDWEFESLIMGQIYLNSFCVLAATSSTNSQTGLFFSRNPHSLRPLIAEPQWEGCKGLYICQDLRNWMTQVENSSLLRRAWVTQERNLAVRVLHFTESQLFWECVSLDACETFPHGIEETLTSLMKNWSPVDFKFKRGMGKHYNASKSEQDIYVIWQRIVQQLTNAKLTRSSDKLAAVAGVAKEMQRFLGHKDQYIAGLWRKNLVSHLLWENQYRGETERSKIYRAPSWSWASLDGPIRLNNFSGQEGEISLVSILDIQVHSGASDPFLQVTSGFLRISGYLTKADMLREHQPHNSVRLCIETGKLDVHSLGTVDCRHTMKDVDTALCMPLQLRTDGDGEKHISGLLLKVVNEGKSELRRFGSFSLSSTGSCDNFLGVAKTRVLSKIGPATRDEQGRYTVTII